MACYALLALLETQLMSVALDLCQGANPRPTLFRKFTYYDLLIDVCFNAG